MSIHHLKNEAVNRKKYHKCLLASYNANAFAYPWYLDLVCDHWELLIEGDYETVCPLPLQKHFGFTTVKQPPLAPFLGVFSSKDLPPAKVSHFMKAIPYANVHLTLNHFNRLEDTLRSATSHISVLDLILPREFIQRHYTPEALKVLEQPDNTSILRTIRPDAYMNFKKSQGKTGLSSQMELTRIINYALRYKSAGIYTVYSLRNELIGALFLIKTNHRVFLIDAIESQEGRENHAIFRAVDHIIKANCGSNLTLELPFGNFSLTSLISFKPQYCQQYNKGIL